MSTNMQDPDREDLGAEGNDALIDPLPQDERQPRADEVDPEEPFDAPADPLKNVPSKIEGDPAEDEKETDGNVPVANLE